MAMSAQNIPYRRLAHGWFRVTLHHFHEYLLALLAMVDSPHFIVLALLGLAALCICAALILAFEV